MDRPLRLAAAALLIGCSDPSYRDPDQDADAQVQAPEDGAVAVRDGGRDAAPESDAALRNDAGEELITFKDAGPLKEPAPDGGEVVLASALPDWAKPLLGHYAGRSYQFSQDSFRTVLRTREYAVIDIVEIRGSDPHVELRLHVCDSFGESEASESRVVTPELSTVRVHRVLFGDHNWFTQTPDNVDGFVRELPERCVGHEGTAVAKDPAQTWIAASTCSCPSSIDVAPNKPEDCRIIDQDQDGNPGSSIDVTPKALLGPARLFAATINRSLFMNGAVGGDGRHSAQILVDQFGWQLGCTPAGCADISQTPAPCAPSRNKLELVHQDAVDFGCSQVIANAASLFPNGIPELGSVTSCP